MANIVALLDSMWGWGGYNDAGDDAPRYFRINADNHSGRRLYRLCGQHSLLVSNCCRTVQLTANHHGKPDVEWVRSNLAFLSKEKMHLLLVCGRIAQATFEIATGFNLIRMPFPKGKVTFLGCGSDEVDYMYIDHPAARRWSNAKLNDTAREIDVLCRERN